MSDLNRPVVSTPAFWRRLDVRISQHLRRIARPLRGVLGAVSGSEKGLLARLSGRADEELSSVELAQHFGFRSLAPSGVEAVAIPIGGAGSHLVIVGEIDRGTTPPSLLAGEVAIYSSGGAVVMLLADGSVEISGTMVKLNGPGPGVARIGDSVTVTGKDSINGDIVATGIIASGSATVQAGG